MNVTKFVQIDDMVIDVNVDEEGKILGVTLNNFEKEYETTLSVAALREIVWAMKETLGHEEG